MPEIDAETSLTLTAAPVTVPVPDMELPPSCTLIAVAETVPTPDTEDSATARRAAEDDAVA